jgi:adenine-specific DNA-methyltransferase
LKLIATLINISTIGKKMKDLKKNKYGQYFTPKLVADFMVSLLNVDKRKKILEPCCGDGIFLKALDDAGFLNFEGIEFDSECIIDKKYTVINKDYLLEENLSEKYAGIIGNPPYIRWKNLPNELKINLNKCNTWSNFCTSLSDYSTAFIAKAINDLEKDGTLVFITPEYWLYTVHSQKVRNLLLEEGSVDRIYHFDESKIFNDVTASLIVFRFQKSKHAPTIVWKIKNPNLFTHECLEKLSQGQTTDNYQKFELQKFKLNQRWSLESESISKKLNTLEENCKNKSEDFFDFSHATLGDVCDIANGMVSGLDKAFQIDKACLNITEENATIQVAKAKQLDGTIVKATTTYIFLSSSINEITLETIYPNFFHALSKYKENLQKRYSYKKVAAYWEWSFLRNYKTLSKPCQKIFIPCKERLGDKESYRFTLAAKEIYPTQDVTAIILKDEAKESIYYIQAYLRLPIVTQWIKSRGVVRGGVTEFSEAPLSSIPFRKINWKSKEEVEIYEEINRLCISNASADCVTKERIKNLFSKLVS